jgi:hypothetical protein
MLIQKKKKKKKNLLLEDENKAWIVNILIKY